MTANMLETATNTIEKRAGNLLVACDLDYPPKKFISYMLTYGFGIGFGLGLIFVNYSIVWAVETMIGTAVIFETIILGMMLVTANRRMTAIEDALPDFLGMLASDIKSGVTYDRALILASRKEFGPLAREIDIAAKDTITGKPLQDALMGIASRVRSEVLSKTMRLIVEGVNSGGNLGELLENTSLDIRRYASIRKEVAATVLTYQLFMLVAAAFGAPAIYSVTTFLIEVIANTKSKIGASMDISNTFLPFFKAGGISISPETMFWFSMAAILVTSFFGAMAVGVISKGKESEGITYFPIVWICAVVVYFVVKVVLGIFIGGLF